VEKVDLAPRVEANAPSIGAHRCMCVCVFKILSRVGNYSTLSVHYYTISPRCE